MRGDLLLLLADAIAILCITRFLLRYAGLAAEHPLLKFQHTGNRLADQTLAKSISIRRENRLVLSARRFSGVLPCLCRHYFHLAGAVHQQ